MRVISPLGKILEVDRVVPIIERTDSFNNGHRFDGETVKYGVKPNGLAFRYGIKNAMGIVSELVVGNLPAEKCEEILVSLLRDGYYDLRMEYQKEKDFFKLAWGMDALPYTSDITIAPSRGYCAGGWSQDFGYPFGYNPCFETSVDCEDEDLEEDSEDE